MSATRTGPGRHRSAAADAAILEATLAVLRERGYERLTVAAVIERAKVSSATLYRRWPTKHELVAAAVASLAPEAVHVDTGTLAGDIAALVDHVARAVTARGDIVDSLQGGTRDAELAQAMRDKLVTPRVEALDAILRRAVARGELGAAPAAEICLAFIIGPVHYRVFVLNEPLTQQFVDDLLQHTLFGLAPRAPTA